MKILTKMFISLILICVLTQSAWALDKCMTGNWYDPTTDDGRGFALEVLENRNMAVAHFYDWYGGRRDHFIFSGDNLPDDETFYFNAFQSLVSGTAAGTQYVGGGEITYIDNNSVLFEYTWQYNHLNTSNTMHWCIGCSSIGEYNRLTQPIECVE